MVQALSSSVMHVDVRLQILNERLHICPGLWAETRTLGLYYIILGRMVIAQTSVIGYQQYACHTSKVGLATAATLCLWVLVRPGASCAAVLLRRLPTSNYFAVVLL